jgi:hypothetical protein
MDREHCDEKDHSQRDACDRYEGAHQDGEPADQLDEYGCPGHDI